MPADRSRRPRDEARVGAFLGWAPPAAAAGFLLRRGRAIL